MSVYWVLFTAEAGTDYTDDDEDYVEEEEDEEEEEEEEEETEDEDNDDMFRKLKQELGINPSDKVGKRGFRSGKKANDEGK